MEFEFIMVIDIIVTLLISYKAITLIRETRAIHLLNGVLVLFIISFATQILGLRIFNLLLAQIRTMVLIALPVVFQPELRRALEQIGRGKMLSYLTQANKSEIYIDKLVSTVIRMGKEKIGGLVVLKRESGLKEIIDTGVELDAKFSPELLLNIFNSKAPLHDGAVIIHNERILAASCILPLTKNKRLKQSLGTRHRAAVGMSEESDALVIVVSEETGVVSTMENGKIKYNLDEFSLKEKLLAKFEEIDVK
ncbi:diadenylate cyclase CdaA [Halonatronum saccharophilum]|uniref:diadenylate cyclase CdaA n=1 Tax=Halonatronum saccharophilum TaxID=150060 RepID=UPI000489D1A1|nr:diadenylate cyclase CdaA [Halonatronum saccharophilum]